MECASEGVEQNEIKRFLVFRILQISQSMNYQCRPRLTFSAVSLELTASSVSRALRFLLVTIYYNSVIYEESYT